MADQQRQIPGYPADLPAYLVDNGDGSFSLKIATTGTVTVEDARSATTAATNVVSSATVVTILAANVARLGATVFNDSTQILYLKLGAAASATSYTVQVAASGYYEVPFNYTGILTGLWASANGNARVVELT